MHGAGFTGSGEDHLASMVDVEASRDGRVRVLTSSTEIGQGTNTVFAQIAADALGVEHTGRPQEPCVLVGVDVVGDDRHRQGVGELAAQQRDQRALARADRAADAEAKTSRWCEGIVMH